MQHAYIALYSHRHTSKYKDYASVTSTPRFSVKVNGKPEDLTCMYGAFRLVSATFMSSRAYTWR